MRNFAVVSQAQGPLIKQLWRGSPFTSLLRSTSIARAALLMLTVYDDVDVLALDP
jgi:hypothetical protein